MAIDLAQLTMDFDLRYVLCIQKHYHRPHFTVGRCWNKTFHIQPLRRCYCENSGSPASAYIMRRHYSITYTQSFQAINDLLAVVRVGNLLCGRTFFGSFPFSCWLNLNGTSICLYNSIHVSCAETVFVAILKFMRQETTFEGSLLEMHLILIRI